MERGAVRTPRQAESGKVSREGDLVRLDVLLAAAAAVLLLLVVLIVGLGVLVRRVRLEVGESIDSLVALFAAFPAALIKTIAGLGLLGSLAGALASAIGDERQRFAGVLAFAVTASGIAVLGIGSAFWGLVAGLAALALDPAARRASAA